MTLMVRPFYSTHTVFSPAKEILRISATTIIAAGALSLFGKPEKVAKCYAAAIAAVEVAAVTLYGLACTLCSSEHEALQATVWASVLIAAKVFTYMKSQNKEEIDVILAIGLHILAASTVGYWMY